MSTPIKSGLTPEKKRKKVEDFKANKNEENILEFKKCPDNISNGCSNTANQNDF